MCVELYASRKTRSANNIGIRSFQFPRFGYVFVHTNYTSNMAACCDNDITSPHAYHNVLHYIYRGGPDNY